MVNKKIIMIIILLILFFVLGIGTGLFIGKKLLVQKRDSNDTFKAGWAAAGKRLMDIGIVSSQQANYEIKSLSGTVEKIADNTIQIKTVPLEPLADPSLDYRTIYLTKNTVITKVVKKSDEQYSKEMKELTSAEIQARGPDSPDGYVGRFYTENADAKEIKVGSRLNVDAGEDIKEKSEITAEKITIAE
jgi:uncharacterized protein YkvS